MVFFYVFCGGGGGILCRITINGLQRGCFRQVYRPCPVEDLGFRGLGPRAQGFRVGALGVVAQASAWPHRFQNCLKLPTP